MVNSTKNNDEEEADKFFEYYKEQSESKETYLRFVGIYNTIKRIRHANNLANTSLTIADIGCGAGTQSIIWAKDGHRVHGIDINERLIDLANKRAEGSQLEAEFIAGTATSLPWKNETMDVCLAPELLEHVPEWEKCLDEFDRILKKGGVLFITTSNRLCPKQNEFELPCYSWYPSKLKKYYEKLAVTTRPELVCHAEYPAVNWFSFFQLQKELKKKGYISFDRFDVMDTGKRALPIKIILAVIRTIKPIRFMAHVFTPYTTVYAIKKE
jgi:2-polyprenyl-6-hydroxyphenyl methylase/3-demethylubiquinone-9 3-methyltransferase